MGLRWDPESISQGEPEKWDAQPAPISQEVIDFFKRPSLIDRLVSSGLARAVKLPKGQPRFQPELVDTTHKEMYDDLVLNCD